jgi:rhamnose utilization protein RhaD (predicted bifunctional aldolase and dehydrogenase)
MSRKLRAKTTPVLTASPQISDLRSLSAKLGRDPLLVQAASGNTSIKIGGLLWIKASGKWLADADLDQIFVPVDMGTMSISRAMGTMSVHNPGLSPSIETAMHAVLPHRVVIHVHSVNAISWLVREDGPALVAERLKGLSWAWIPYVPSGFPLAREIQRGHADVFLLANHGLVVAADDCEAAAALLADVERRLHVDPRIAPLPNRAHLDRMSRGTGWHPPAEPIVHALGTDPVSQSIFEAGTIYPCHGLFLGPGTAECNSYDTPASAAEIYRARYGSRPSTIAVRGEGLLVTDEMTVTQMQVLIGLALVIQRIGPEARVRYLTECESAELLSTDACQYRQNVEARAALAVL